MEKLAQLNSLTAKIFLQIYMVYPRAINIQKTLDSSSVHPVSSSDQVPDRAIS